MNSARWKAIAGAAAIAAAGAAQAQLVDQGTTTLDSATGLVWLDLTAALGRSMSDVSNEFGTGGDFAGYRYATAAEVATFIADAGLVPGNGANGYAPTKAFVDLVGATSTQTGGLSTVDTAAGFHLPDPPNPGRVAETLVRATDRRFGTDDGDVLTLGNAGADTRTDAEIGSWLVSSVPEPSTALSWLAGLAAIGLYLGRRRSTS
jgi:hypothetical protein